MPALIPLPPIENSKIERILGSNRVLESIALRKLQIGDSLTCVVRHCTILIFESQQLDFLLTIVYLKYKTTLAAFFIWQKKHKT